MRNETAEAKKGTWKRGRRCTPGQRHEEEAKPGQLLPQKGRGAGVMYKSGSWPTNPGRGRGEKEGQDHKEERWGREGGESQFEASCQFQTNRSMYIPSTSSQKLIFSATDNHFVSSQPKWSMAFSFHTALQTAR